MRSFSLYYSFDIDRPRTTGKGARSRSSWLDTWLPNTGQSSAWSAGCALEMESALVEWSGIIGTVIR